MGLDLFTGLDLGAAPAGESLRLDLLLPAGLPIAFLVLNSVGFLCAPDDRRCAGEEFRWTAITQFANVAGSGDAMTTGDWPWEHRPKKDANNVSMPTILSSPEEATRPVEHRPQQMDLLMSLSWWLE